jgi:hypothetical protein
MAHAPRLFYCTAVYDRWVTFDALYKSFFAHGAEADQFLCVYDWNGAGKDIFAAQPPWLRYGAGRHVSNINRAAARNESFGLITAPAPADLVFFVDCDMVLPLDFSQRIREHVRPGHVYFPVCYSLYRGSPMVVNGDGPPFHKNGSNANGWWRDSGRGNCGFTVADFQKLGGWDGERFGTRYGREDDDVFWRAVAQYEVHRERVPGFFHQWHTMAKEEQNPSTKRNA